MRHCFDGRIALKAVTGLVRTMSCHLKSCDHIDYLHGLIHWAIQSFPGGRHREVKSWSQLHKCTDNAQLLLAHSHTWGSGVARRKHRKHRESGASIFILTIFATAIIPGILYHDERCHKLSCRIAPSSARAGLAFPTILRNQHTRGIIFPIHHRISLAFRAGLVRCSPLRLEDSSK